MQNVTIAFVFENILVLAFCLNDSIVQYIYMFHISFSSICISVKCRLVCFHNKLLHCFSNYIHKIMIYNKYIDIDR